MGRSICEEAKKRDKKWDEVMRVGRNSVSNLDAEPKDVDRIVAADIHRSTQDDGVHILNEKYMRVRQLTCEPKGL